MNLNDMPILRTMHNIAPMSRMSTEDGGAMKQRGISRMEIGSVIVVFIP